jgi:imidazolonepropionase-like amidohydrolase
MRGRARAAVALAAGLLFAGAAAPQDSPPGEVLIRAGDLFDSESGRMVGPRDILIRGDLVAAVAPRLAPPPGARILDLRNCAVLPGLIDAHTHLLMEEGADEDPSVTALREQVVLGEGYRALQGAGRARSYLQAGFTTVRDLGNSGSFLDVALKRAIARGDVPGPRIYASGPGPAPEGGQLRYTVPGRSLQAAGEYRIVNGADDARRAVREAAAGGADLIKVYPEATPNRARLSPEELSAVVTEARRHGMTVAAHASTDAGVREAVEAGVTSIEHAHEAGPESFRLMAARRTVFVPTFFDRSVFRRLMAERETPDEAFITRQLAPFQENLRRAAAAGVPIAGGSDFYIRYPEGRGVAARRMVFAYAEAGLSNAAALQAVTSGGARLLGESRLGRVRPEAFADLVAVNGNPVQDLSAIERIGLVMKAGRVERDGSPGCGGATP